MSDESNSSEVADLRKSLGNESFIEAIGLAAAPVVGSGVSDLVDWVDARKRRQLQRKMLACFEETQRINTADVQRFVAGLRVADKIDEAGDHLFEMVDKATSVDRARAMGRLFAFCVTEGIGWDDTVQMSEMLAKAGRGDLEYFLDSAAEDVYNRVLEADRLVALGFYAGNQAGRRWKSGQVMEPYVSPPHGEWLYRALGGVTFEKECERCGEVIVLYSPLESDRGWERYELAHTLSCGASAEVARIVAREAERAERARLGRESRLAREVQL